jgi:hypothetical protein
VVLRLFFALEVNRWTAKTRARADPGLILGRALRVRERTPDPAHGLFADLIPAQVTLDGTTTHRG